MNLFGKEYSASVEALLNGINPRPIICEYPSLRLASGQNPKYSGMHIYQPAVGDLVFIVPGETDDYTLAHELMHVALRREGYPHLTLRDTGTLEAVVASPIVQQLDGTTLHPLLNRRLSDIGIEQSSRYSQELGESALKSIGLYKDYLRIQPEGFLRLPLMLAEISMWPGSPRGQLRANIPFTEAWQVTDDLLSICDGLSNGTPEICRRFSLEAVKLMDRFLHLKSGRGETTYLDVVMFPPPPFVGDVNSPASQHFGVRLTEMRTKQWDLEIYSLIDKTLCWSDGPLDAAKMNDRLIAIQSSLSSFSAKEFADFCDRLFATVTF